jgi:hypothetical protein
MAPRSEILCLAWLDPYHGLQWEDAKLSMMMEQLDLPLGNSKSSSCSLLLLAPYGKGERAPPSSNPYLLWMRASRWSPWPSLAAFQASIPSPFSSFPFPLLAWVWEHRERWTRERMGVQEWVNEWVSELVGALPWSSQELDRCAFGWGQVNSQSDTSHFCTGWFYRMLCRDDGLSGGVGLLTDRDWTLSGHANELADGLVVLVDHLSSQQWADWMRSLVQFSF